MTERYTFTNGWTMQREAEIPGYWLVFDEHGKQVDRHQYRYDLFDRHRLKIAEHVE